MEKLCLVPLIASGCLCGARGMTNPSLCMYFSRLLSLDGLYFFLRAKVSFGGDWCMLFCPATVPHGMNAGRGDALVLAGGIFLQHPLLVFQEDLCWCSRISVGCSTRGSCRVGSLQRPLQPLSLITVQYRSLWALSFVSCFSDVNDLMAIWPCFEIPLPEGWA